VFATRLIGFRFESLFSSDVPRIKSLSREKSRMFCGFVFRITILIIVFCLLLSFIIRGMGWLSQYSTRLRAERLEPVTGKGSKGIFLFAAASSPALRSIQPLIQWFPGAFPQG
jgi:hypothetical protein